MPMENANYFRMKSQEIHSFSNLAFGVVLPSLQKAPLPAPEGGKRTFVFSSVGVGPYPIVMVTFGPAATLKMLAKGKDWGFAIKGYAQNQFDYARGAHQEKDADHEIWCSWINFSTTKKQIVVHDAAMAAAKNVILAAAGPIGGGIHQALTAGVAVGTTAAAGELAEKVSASMEAVKGIGEAVPDIYDIQEQLRGEGKSKKGGGCFGLLIAPFPLEGGITTGASSVSAPRLGDAAAYLLSRGRA